MPDNDLLQELLGGPGNRQRGDLRLGLERHQKKGTGTGHVPVQKERLGVQGVLRSILRSGTKKNNPRTHTRYNSRDTSTTPHMPLLLPGNDRWVPPRSTNRQDNLRRRCPNEVHTHVNFPVSAHWGTVRQIGESPRNMVRSVMKPGITGRLVYSNTNPVHPGGLQHGSESGNRARVGETWNSSLKRRPRRAFASWSPSVRCNSIASRETCRSFRARSLE